MVGACAQKRRLSAAFCKGSHMPINSSLSYREDGQKDSLFCSKSSLGCAFCLFQGFNFIFFSQLKFEWL